MNLIDKTIAVFSPQKALNREVARKRLEILANYGNYGANQQKKSMIGWQTRSQSPDEDIVKFIASFERVFPYNYLDKCYDDLSVELKDNFEFYKGLL